MAMYDDGVDRVFTFIPLTLTVTASHHPGWRSIRLMCRGESIAIVRVVFPSEGKAVV